MSRILLRVCAVVVLMLLSQACENTKADPAQEAAVRQSVNAYLQALAKAYSDVSVAPIEDLATNREIEDVRKILKQLVSTGDRLEAKLLSVDFGNISVFRGINATVTTTEVWDVTRYDEGTGVEKGHNPASVQKSVLQLRLIDGKWKVLARRVMETQGASKWKMPSGAEEPTPPAETEDTGSAQGDPS